MDTVASIARFFFSRRATAADIILSHNLRGHNWVEHVVLISTAIAAEESEVVDDDERTMETSVRGAAALSHCTLLLLLLLCGACVCVQ